MRADAEPLESHWKHPGSPQNCNNEKNDKGIIPIVLSFAPPLRASSADSHLPSDNGFPTNIFHMYLQGLPAPQAPRR